MEFVCNSYLKEAHSSVIMPAAPVGIKNFVRINLLGKGSFGKVILTRKEGGSDGGQLYAMKIIKKTPYLSNASALNERKILEAVTGITFLGGLHYAFQTKQNFYLILDYLNGGNLTHRNLKTHDVKFYIGELVLALEHLHKLGIIHRDIKGKNILLDQDGHIVLIDFGLSMQFPEGDINKKTKLMKLAGTRNFMSYEIVTRQEHSFPVDWWAVGILTHFLLAKWPPFYAKSPNEVLHNIIYRSPKIKRGLPETAVSFIKKLLIKDQNKRLGGQGGGAKEVKAHVFLQDMDWELLARKRYPPPIKPTILHGSVPVTMDTSNFDTTFTDATLEDFGSDESITSSDIGYLNNFSYSAPHCVKDNTIEGVLNANI